MFVFFAVTFFALFPSCSCMILKELYVTVWKSNSILEGRPPATTFMILHPRYLAILDSGGEEGMC